MVEPVDVLGHGDLDVDDGLPATLRAHDRVADALGLEQRVQRLGHRIVVGITLRPDRCDGLAGIFLITSSEIATVSETGVVDQLITVLGGFVALIFIWVTQTRINSANYYLATVNMQAFFEKLLGIALKKWIWAAIVGVVVAVMMSATDVFTYILTALTYQGIFVTAWVGVAVTHILSGKYERMFGDRVYYHSVEVPNFNPAGLTAWFVAAGTGLVMTLTETAASYAPVVTVLLSVAIYAAFLRGAKRSWFTVEPVPAVSNEVVST